MKVKQGSPFPSSRKTRRSSVADPDPKEPHHFAGFENFPMDPDPNLNIAHLKKLKISLSFVNKVPEVERRSIE